MVIPSLRVLMGSDISLGFFFFFLEVNTICFGLIIQNLKLRVSFHWSSHTLSVGINPRVYDWERMHSWDLKVLIKWGWSRAHSTSPNQVVASLKTPLPQTHWLKQWSLFHTHVFGHCWWRLGAAVSVFSFGFDSCLFQICCSWAQAVGVVNI